MKTARNVFGWVGAAALIAAPFSAMADDATAKATTSQWSVMIGAFSPKEASGPMASEIASGMLAAAAGFRLNEHFRFEVDLSAYGRRYDTLPSMPAYLASTDSTFNVNSAAVSAVLKAPFAAGGVTWFGAVGAGLYTTTAVVTGTTAGATGNFQIIDRGVGGHLAAGADVEINKHVSIGVEWRYLALKADLDNISQGEISVGGPVLAIALRGGF